MPVINNPFDNEKLAAIRAEQTDPLVQYFIINKDLKMSPGKSAAQVAHAANMFCDFYHTEYDRLMSSWPRGGHEWSRILVSKRWREESYRKVILVAKATKFAKIKEELECFLVRDAGLTEVDPGSETVLALFPIKKSKAPNIIKRLRVYA